MRSPWGRVLKGIREDEDAVRSLGKNVYSYKMQALVLGGMIGAVGGFVGGLLAGSAITLRYIAGGIDEVRRHSRFRPWTVLGTGLLVAVVTATVPLLLGGDVLEVGFASLDLPVIGQMSLSSALAFDTGVYLAVVGMVLMAFEAFGDEPAEAAA